MRIFISFRFRFLLLMTAITGQPLQARALRRYFSQQLDLSFI